MHGFTHPEASPGSAEEVSSLPGLLQTSPYLTHVTPGHEAPVVYMSDTFGPTFPSGAPPGSDVLFGLVALDRTIVWQSDRLVLDMLRECASRPCGAARLAGRFGAERVSSAVRRGWLQAPDELCREYRLVSGEIEVTSHCNWGCSFCPVSIEPKPRRTMPMHLFEEVIGKLADVSTLEYVTFQFFNEPTLDRYFNHRVQVLARYGLKLALYTNGSALTGDKVDCLRRHSVLRHLIVNLPSADKDEFAELTGSRSYRQTTRNLERALEAGFPVQIVVNGAGARLARNLDALRRRYEPLGAQVCASQTCDRAGELRNEHFQDVHVAGRLTGCGWPVHHANISVDGDLFLCCNDYHQREVFGHIRDGSIDELMTSEMAVTARRKVFGVLDADDDFLCRRCHNQQPDYPGRDFRPLATFG
ncbi:radical SAM/SPASM domain-containing protein [Actinomadura sp. WMMB 499]|uniref:radical SAM/SPASM domain-containing protein n=1 Tax=Actinomadura sp. WMMB 499 TaxID=1219491 RepID=UPI0012476914|nr:radical SAM/SPASM domain-containing protein [Actinomadura sp. WMMB 499]QFG23732.1 radical SAM protein [Actinomadura sp. WMMB 499]